MCKRCDYPSPDNHANFMACMQAWRERAYRAEACESALKSRLAAAAAELAEIRTDLDLKLYATADSDLERALRILEGRG
jgi:hypothetical protein